LRRLCAAVGNHGVLFVSCSATIENPAEHMRTIFGIDQVEVVDQDGSPTGQKVSPFAICFSFEREVPMLALAD
jgi:DEAD/DEAH box helicase domain-containing protein